ILMRLKKKGKELRLCTMELRNPFQHSIFILSECECLKIPFMAPSHQNKNYEFLSKYQISLASFERKSISHMVKTFTISQN
ncbi:hypothetical protein BLOT_014278, partial [Blomia tropicalis]